MVVVLRSRVAKPPVEWVKVEVEKLVLRPPLPKATKARRRRSDDLGDSKKSHRSKNEKWVGVRITQFIGHIDTLLRRDAGGEQDGFLTSEMREYAISLCEAAAKEVLYHHGDLALGHVMYWVVAFAQQSWSHVARAGEWTIDAKARHDVVEWKGVKLFLQTLSAGGFSYSKETGDQTVVTNDRFSLVNSERRKLVGFRWAKERDIRSFLANTSILLMEAGMPPLHPSIVALRRPRKIGVPNSTKRSPSSTSSFSARKQRRLENHPQYGGSK